MTQDVSVSIAFDEAAYESMMMTIPGGIRVEIGDIEVTRDTSQESGNTRASEERPNEIWWYDHVGQPLDAGALDYKGGFSIYVTISGFAENVLKLARGSPGRFDQLVSDIGDTPTRLVLSYLDGSHDLVRVAYQDLQRAAGTDHNPTVRSAVGYAVSLSALCGEVARCLNEFVEYVEAHSLDAHSNTRFQSIKGVADELERFSSKNNCD